MMMVVITVFILIIVRINIIAQLEIKHLLLKFNAALPTGRGPTQINPEGLWKVTASREFC